MEKPLIDPDSITRTPRVSQIHEHTLRASSYTIYVDLPDDKDVVLLVHGYTGAYDLVAQEIASYVRSLEVRRPPRPLYGAWTPHIPPKEEFTCPSDHIIEQLKDRGYLTEQSLEEEEAHFVSIANMYHAKALRSIPRFILMPTYDCNLRCSYCFQDHMRTNPAYNHLLHTMTRPMLERIFAGILDLELQHDLPPADQYIRHFTLFGGEPLLARNRHVVDAIIDQASHIGKASFSAITNATELKAYQDLLNPQCIGTIQVTLDGPADEHDQRRIYADGSGSFEKIASHITMALEQEVLVQLRINVDRRNVQLLPRLAQEFIDRGWNTYSNFSPYAAPIHVGSNRIDQRELFDSWSLSKALKQLCECAPAMHIIHRPDDGLKTRVRHLIENQMDAYQHAHYCGASSSMYVIDPFANVYACWERTGDEKIRIGHFTPNGHYQMDSKFSAIWRNHNVTTNKICRQCRYALNCGGGCAVLAESRKGGTFGNYCDGYTARFRTSVAEAYLESFIGAQAGAAVENICDS